MSMFLPEGQGQAPGGTGASLAPPSTETTQEDIALMQRVLAAAARNPNLIPSDFMAYVFDYIQVGRLQVPIGQVFGFSQFTVNSATVATQESTTSASYADLTTSGPTLSGLASGHYIVLVGAVAKSSDGNGAFLSVSLNGATPVDANGGETQSTGFTSVVGVSIQTLISGGNSLKAQYRVNSGTGTFLNRWILALKYANL